jgi:glycine/D-amino acid oxidase-like deaminating enzyme
MQRRNFLKYAGMSLAATATAGASAADSIGEPPITGRAVPGCVPPPRGSPAASLMDLPLIRAQPDRLIAVTVCTRPFRNVGPRIEAEKLGRKTIVHNYGHGGSGWSLSWGSATFAMRLVKATNVGEIGILGAGAIGLTSAIMAQRAGLKVRIYAKDRFPDVRSTFATGSWTPNSRFCTQEALTPEIGNRWEEMTRITHRMYQHMLGLPGNPIEWRDNFQLSSKPFDPDRKRERLGEPEYPDLEKRVRDLTPRRQELPPGTHPFPLPYVRRGTNMIYNISAYSRMLMADFLANGGVIETREFEKPGDVAKLKEKTIVNATGYGARALFGDESIIPVRGQLMKLIPQPEIEYGLSYDDEFSVAPRRDGIVVQAQGDGGDFNNPNDAPDRAAAERTVQMLADVTEQIRAIQTSQRCS